MNKNSWRDVTEAELAATGKVVRGSVKSSRGLEGAMLPQERSKYRNVKCIVQGERFDSQREADAWLGLLARQAAGEIEGLQRQVHFPLCTVKMDEVGAS